MKTDTLCAFLETLSPSKVIDNPLKSFMDIALTNLIKEQKIGEGTYGKVYLARPKQVPALDLTVAIKRNLVDHTTDFSGSVKELDLLRALRGHPYVVQFIAISLGDPFNSETGMLSPLRSSEKEDYKDDKIHFVFEAAAYDAHELIYEKGTDYEYLKEGFRQLLVAVEYIHAKRIVHRDIKPANILVFYNKKNTKAYTFKLCDFGLAKPFTLQGAQSPRTITSTYRAPEVCLKENYDQKVDIWSLGCVFFELIAKSPFIDIKNDKNMDEKLLPTIIRRLPEQLSTDYIKEKGLGGMGNRSKKRQSFSDMLRMSSENVKDFNKTSGDFDDFCDVLGKMLIFDPTNRWNATELLNHSFFKSYKDQTDEDRKQCPPIPPVSQPLEVLDCIERKWMIGTAFSIYNNKKRTSWYSHRMLFQSIDLFDRYLVWAFSRLPKGIDLIESEHRGLLHTKYDTELRFYVCLYLSVKYFTTIKIVKSYRDVVPSAYKTAEARLKAEHFEMEMLTEILKCEIYRETIYEAADQGSDKQIKKLSDREVEDLLRIYGNITSYHGLNARELYNLINKTQTNLQ